MALGFRKRLSGLFQRGRSDDDERRIRELEGQIAQLRQTEQRLRDQYTSMQRAAKAARIDTWIWNRHTDQITYPNTDPQRLVKYPKTLTEFFTLVAAEDVPKIQEKVNHSLSEKTSYDVEYRARRSDDRETWYYNTGHIHYDENGEVAGLMGITVNIGHIKRAEASLRVSEAAANAFQQRLKALHEVSVELAKTDSLDEFYRKAVELGRTRLGFERVGLFLIDQQRNLACGTYGTDRYGQTVDSRHVSFSMGDDFTDNLDKKHHPNMIVYDDHHLSDGGQVVGRGWNIMAMLWDEDNPTGWLAADNLIHHGPLTDQHLELFGLYASMLGALILKKQAEIETQRHQERLRLALQAGRLRVWEWKQGEDKIIYHEQLNSERPLFHSFSAMMDYVIPEDQEKVSQIRSVCFDQGLPVQQEFRILLPDGNLRWLFSLGHPYRDETGQVAGIIGVTQDITDRKESEERGLELALQKERITLMTEFLGNISHDMKTPLSVMNTSLYLLEQLDEPEQRARKIETIRDQAALMERFIQDLLTISRLDYAPAWDMKSVNLNTLLLGIQAQLQPAIDHHQLSLVLDLDVNLPPALGDSDELNRMLVNLVENAVHYTPANGSVVVQTRFDDGAIRVEVSDSGIGISQEELPLIFGRFYRADAARKSRQGGTGLGLAIVKRIVEIHQGEISVTSEAGRGTTFRLRLPIAPETMPV